MPKRFYLATPCYGSLCPDYVLSMLSTQKALVDAGHTFDIGFVQGLCYVHQARNWLTKNFLASKADEMIFIDSDLGWHPQEFLRFAGIEVNVVGGAVPFRTGELGFPVSLTDDGEGFPRGKAFADTPDSALLEAIVVPSALMKITRGVFDKLAERGDAPWRIERDPVTSAEKKRWRSFFDFEVEQDPLSKKGADEDFFEFGEDVSFCHKCTRAGFGLWVDPRMTLRHWGMHGFGGQLDMWLKRPESEVSGSEQPKSA